MTLEVLFWALVVASVACAVALVWIGRRLRLDADLAEEIRKIEPMSREDMERQRELWRRVKRAMACNRRRGGNKNPLWN